MATSPPSSSRNLTSSGEVRTEKRKVQIISLERIKSPIYPKITNDAPIVYKVWPEEKKEVIKIESKINTPHSIAPKENTKKLDKPENSASQEKIETTSTPDDKKSSESQCNASEEDDKLIDSKPNSSRCCERFMVGLHILCIVLALGYGAGGYFSAFDEKGLDVYFEGESTEYDLITGLAHKILNANAEIKTDNWGYFERAYSRVKSDSSSKWSDYNVFLYILITTGTTVVLCLIATILSIYNLIHDNMDFISKGLIFHSIVLILFLTGNGYSWFQIYGFHSDFKDSFEKCNCDNFEADYYTSIKLYFISTGGMFIALLMQLIMSILQTFSSSSAKILSN